MKVRTVYIYAAFNFTRVSNYFSLNTSLTYRKTPYFLSVIIITTQVTVEILKKCILFSM
jgi:hypothetical protein